MPRRLPIRPLDALISLPMLAALADNISKELERYQPHADVTLKFRLRKLTVQAAKLGNEIMALPKPSDVSRVKPASRWAIWKAKLAFRWAIWKGRN